MPMRSLFTVALLVTAVPAEVQAQHEKVFPAAANARFTVLTYLAIQK